MAFVKKKQGMGKTLVNGTITGAIEALICYPTELVKTQLQLQSKTAPQYSGIMDCAIKTVKTNGFTGLYKGAAPLFIGSSFKQAARWTAYTNASSYFRDDQGKIGVVGNMISGVCAGTSEAILAVTPMETIKNRVTDDMRKGTKKYTGSFDAISKIVKSEGPSGLYMGVTATIAKQATNQMVRFPLQAMYMSLFVGEDPEKRSAPLWNGLAGAMAGGSSVFLTMPQDTIKTRMQGEDGRQYKSGLDCLRKTLAKEGPRFLYTGTWPRLVRVTLDVGITFTIYPIVNAYLTKAWDALSPPKA